MTKDTTVIIGAGPYGLAAASHLNAQKLPPLIFGKPMEFLAQYAPAYVSQIFLEFAQPWRSWQ